MVLACRGIDVVSGDVGADGSDAAAPAPARHNEATGFVMQENGWPPNVVLVGQNLL